ncbi:MAG: metallophosphoesterase [bacterium]|nr:metallophosphoesterase [bacterium]
MGNILRINLFIIILICILNSGCSKNLPLEKDGTIYLTGDMHGIKEVDKILEIDFIRENDLLIILGDFGLIWEGKESDDALNMLTELPFEILFIDGNHENFDLLFRYPKSRRYGGDVHIIASNIFHLMRGEIYDISGRSFFAFGGGYSSDWKYRTKGINWWEAEQATDQEKSNAISSLEECEYTVDYVLSHVPDMQNQISMTNGIPMEPEEDGTALFLGEIKSSLTYKQWFCGHFHMDLWINEKDLMLYKNIIKLPIEKMETDLTFDQLKTKFSL